MSTIDPKIDEDKGAIYQAFFLKILYCSPKYPVFIGLEENTPPKETTKFFSFFALSNKLNLLVSLLKIASGYNDLILSSEETFMYSDFKSSAFSVSFFNRIELNYRFY